MAIVDKLEIEITARVQELEKQLASVKSKINSNAQEIQRNNQVLEGSFKKLGLVVAGAFSVNAIKNFGSEAVRTAAQIQSMQTALRAVTGSSTGAAREFAYVTGEADRLGVALDTTLSNYVRLSVAAKGTALEGAGVREVFQGISEAAVTLGLETEKVDRVLYALSQMMSKGKVTSEEFTQQLGDALPGAAQAGARALNVTTQEFFKMMQNGEIVASEFLPKFVKEYRKTFEKELPNAIKSTRASLVRLENGYTTFLAKTGQAITETDAFKDSVQGLTGAFEYLSEVLPKVIRGAGQLAEGAKMAQAANRLGTFVPGQGLATNPAGMSKIPPAMSPIPVDKNVEQILKQYGAYGQSIATNYDKAAQSVRKTNDAVKQQAKDVEVATQKNKNYIKGTLEQAKPEIVDRVNEIKEELDGVWSDSASEMVITYNRALENIHDSIRDSLRDAFMGNINSVEDFLDRVKNLFISTFADIAAANVMQGIFGAGGVASGVMGGGGAKKSGGGGLFGGGGMGGLGGNLISGGMKLAGGSLFGGLNAGIVNAGLNAGLSVGTGAALASAATGVLLPAAAAFALPALFKSFGGTPHPASEFQTQGGRYTFGSKHMDTSYAQGLAGQVQALQQQFGGFGIDTSNMMLRGGVNTKVYGGKGFFETPTGAIRFDDKSEEDTKRALNELAEVMLDLANVADESLRMKLQGLEAQGKSAAEILQILTNEQQKAMEVEKKRTEDLINIEREFASIQAEIVREMQSAANEAERLAGTFGGIAKTLQDTLAEFNLAEFSPLNPQQRYSAAASQFNDVANRARLGDIDALQSLPGAARTFLTESRSFNASGSQFSQDFASVQGIISQSASVASRQSSLQSNIAADINSQLAQNNQSQLSLLTELNARLASMGDTNSDLAKNIQRVISEQTTRNYQRSAA